MGVEGATFGILGALKAFPRRLAAREVAKQGGVLRRGITRRTTHVVFSRSLLDRLPGEEIAKRADELGRTGTVLLSENGFRRLLGLMTRADRAALSTRELAEQSRLGAGLLQVLSLFDAFEHDDEPYSFRDVILARKYGKLIEAARTH